MRTWAVVANTSTQTQDLRDSEVHKAESSNICSWPSNVGVNIPSHLNVKYACEACSRLPHNVLNPPSGTTLLLRPDCPHRRRYSVYDLCMCKICV